MHTTIIHMLMPSVILVAVDFVTVLLAVIADLWSGIRKARKRGQQCTSTGLRRSVDKFCRYVGSLISLVIIDTLVMSSVIVLRLDGINLLPLFPVFTSAGALALTLIEVKSICERAEEKGDFHEALTLLTRLLRRLPPAK